MLFCAGRVRLRERASKHRCKVEAANVLPFNTSRQACVRHVHGRTRRARGSYAGQSRGACHTFFGVKRRLSRSRGGGCEAMGYVSSFFAASGGLPSSSFLPPSCGGFLPSSTLRFFLLRRLRRRFLLPSSFFAGRPLLSPARSTLQLWVRPLDVSTCTILNPGTR